MVKATKQSVIAEQGVALISLRVSEMNHLWHPTSGVDSGIDGEIELRDPATDMVRNFRIGVQSKATAGSWRRETDESFVWRVDSKHVDYWLDSNQPVLLVCSRPRTGEAYWRNIQEWARDPEIRASGLVEFDKRRDVFDASAAARFFSLEAREAVTLGPPGPERHPERLKSNLLPVLWETDVLWSVASPDSSAGAIFQTALAAGAARTDVVLQASRLWSLAPFGEAYLDAIGARDEPAEHALAGIAQSEKNDQQLLLAELTRRSVVAQQWRQLRWYPRGRLAYFRLYDEGQARKLKWARGSGRTVVLPRQSSKHEGLSGYRHDAAELTVRTLGGDWFVVVSPTYLFTFDGRKVSSFHADALKKMKAFDRAAAVSQQLRMWEWLLTRPVTVMDAAEPPAPLQLGALVEFKIDVRPPEGAWKRAPDDLRPSEGELDDEDELDGGQGSLFDDEGADL